MSYDTKCWELAEHFLEDEKSVTDKIRTKLAQTIQDAIEDFLGDIEPDTEPDPDRMLEDRRERDRDEWKHEAAAQQRLK